ncbi:hypothetical protein [Pontibacter cellulosilyticus]|uniref:Uncharacterized protein n=1 Tax=Pontibacter cellulosilyticus TaxID=1720253 RepID=A0A923N6A6_9BACT|nr:hypothetical protein [Pontibacter cellulosilyticus]MBC5993003.1 hypothetical protein [Pontibacter cellulosilyticus]
MKQKKLQLPEELKYENRLKWGYESPDERPKKMRLKQHGNTVETELEVYNFYDYSFSEN